MKYLPVDASLFVENRKKFCAELPAGSLAIFHANDEMPRSADQNFMFRQNPDLFYLSGIDQEQTALMLFPDAPEPKYREVLFIRKTNEHIKVWEGHKYTIEEAKAASGIKTVVWIDEFDAIVGMMMNRTNNVYLNLNENDRAANPVPYRELRFARDARERWPLHTYHRAAPIMTKLRMCKSQPEVDLIQHACNITHKAFERVCRFVRPGVYEYEIEAEILHEFLRNRATGYAYYPIVASGESACILHYQDNNRECRDGDLILMDFGAEYANYNADLSRTIPVNGRFTDRQRAVYDAVLRVMKAATAMLRPGLMMSDYNKEVGRLMTGELIDLGLLNKADVDAQDPAKPLYKKYFMHGTSHHLGLDVHDLADRYVPVQSGMVFTVEPGIYIPDEGIGIRLENDVLVTDGEPKDLMGSIPLEAEAIEDLMNATVPG